MYTILSQASDRLSLAVWQVINTTFLKKNIEKMGVVSPKLIHNGLRLYLKWYSLYLFPGFSRDVS